MTGPTLDYAKMMEGALVGIVREALQQVADDGLPGAHHFYITFRTGDDGVEIDEFLRERYPDEMTIVLQHQFWDLEVGDDQFSVLLSFNDTPSKLTVPYAALTAFIDPSVKFGLQFDDKASLGRQAGTADLPDANGVEAAGDDTDTLIVAQLDGRQDDGAAPGRRAGTTSVAPLEGGKAGAVRRRDDANRDDDDDDEEDDTDSGSAEVVALDQFRRKK